MTPSSKLVSQGQREKLIPTFYRLFSAINSTAMLVELVAATLALQQARSSFNVWGGEARQRVEVGRGVGSALVMNALIKNYLISAN
jgi:hypothetical protein